MSVIGQIPVDMTKIDLLIDGSKKLISFLELKICEFDKQIFLLLNKIIPALCAQSFSVQRGEEIIINYGVIDNLNNRNAQVNFDKPRTFELFIKTGLKQNSESGEVLYEKTEPRLYLNTFRHKLFCFALKLGLAICAMTIDRCKYPIVIDDVFDASDFINRNEISNVIKNLLDEYASHASELGNLQIILLTQDEIIAERVFWGLTKAQNKAKLVRLMNPNEYKEASITRLNRDLTEYKILYSTIDCMKNLFAYNFSCKSNSINFYNVADTVRSNF